MIEQFKKSIELQGYTGYAEQMVEEQKHHRGGRGRGRTIYRGY